MQPERILSDEQVENFKSPLLEHLVELRKRLVIALAAFFAATAVGYGFSEQIYAFLVQPLAASFPDPEHRRLIYTGLTEAFFTYLKLAMFTGILISFPVLAAQGYLFLAPGLYKRERRMILPYLAAAPVLFLAGAALCYWGIMPVAWKFFLSFETASAAGLPIRLEAKVSEYLSLVMHLVLAFGISFQLPVILVLCVQLGLVSSATLAKGRRYAIVLIVALAAVITPPDVFSQIALAVPLYVLYEAAVWVCRGVERKRSQVTG